LQRAELYRLIDIDVEGRDAAGDLVEAEKTATGFSMRAAFAATGGSRAKSASSDPAARSTMFRVKSFMCTRLQTFSVHRRGQARPTCG